MAALEGWKLNDLVAMWFITRLSIGEILNKGLLVRTALQAMGKSPELLAMWLLRS